MNLEKSDLNKKITELEDRNSKLTDALIVAANRLNSVALAAKVHGQNINVQFYIETFTDFSNQAKKAAETKMEKI